MRRHEVISLTEFHPLADAFPLLEGRDFMDLSDDIAANGLNHPVVIFEGKILDGRNRYKACIAAGVEPFRREFVGDFAAARRFVISENLKRRHMTEGERAIAGAKLENVKHGGDRQDANLHLESTITRTAAAEMLGVSPRSIASAAKVLNEGAPELVAAMESGLASVSAAAEVATLPQDDQREIVAAGPAAVIETAKAIRAGGFLANGAFTGNPEWYTPTEYVELARDVMGAIDVDPASNVVAQETVKAATFYTREQNGMAYPWPGRVWLNPPYSQPDIRLFIDKLVDEYESGRTTEAVLLTNNSSDTEWFQRALLYAGAVCFTRGRIKFVSPASASQSPTQGQTFFYFGDNAARFAEAFASVGCTLRHMACAPAERVAA
jgi:phage N-6-adenine-methyltransferase